MSHPSPFLRAAVIAAALIAPLPAAADSPAPTLNLGPDPYDEIRSTGRAVAPPRLRPAASEAPQIACSFEQPACVHAAASVPAPAILWTLHHAERALGTYEALGLPRPLSDGSRGGTPAYDLYLLPEAAAPLTVAELVSPGRGPDRAPAFTVMPPPSERSGCELSAAVAQSIAHAICLRLDAGAEDGAVAMTSSYLASIAAPCALTEIAAIDDFQRSPERSFVATDPDRPTGAMLFPWFLDDAWSRAAPGTVIAALLGLATQITPPGAWEWSNEPDLFDALRANAKQRGTTLDEVLLDFAIARAFTGSRSDGQHLADVARFGGAGRVRFEWSIPYDTLPRRLAPAAPIEPTGMTYLWIDLAGAPPDAELTFVADWELPALFRWSLVKIDKEGAESGRVDVAGVFGSSHVERTVARLDKLAGIVVVGVNAGSIDRAHPFDPDEQPLMPHGYTVMFAK